MTLRFLELHEHDPTVGNGQTFQADATTRTTIPVNVTGFDSKANLPINTATAPTMPNTNGPCPRRFARYANAPRVRMRNAIVRGSRYFVEIRNPRPTEETIPE
jgi:hypothetical protein